MEIPSIRSLLKTCHVSFSPFFNPWETYRYYSLPFCTEPSNETERNEPANKNGNISSKGRHSNRRGGLPFPKQGLGEILVGDRYETSPFEIFFLNNQKGRLLCHKVLWEEELVAFKMAAQQSYFFELLVEDLPMWGFVGSLDGWVDAFGIFTHLRFEIGYRESVIEGGYIITGARIADLNLSDIFADVSITKQGQPFSDLYEFL